LSLFLWRQEFAPDALCLGIKITVTKVLALNGYIRVTPVSNVI